MALTPPPFNTTNTDPLAALCKDLGLGMAAPSISVVYDDFQLEFLEVGTIFFFNIYNFFFLIFEARI